MARINCQPVCGRVVGTGLPPQIEQVFNILALLGTFLGLIGKLISLKDAPFILQVITLLLAFVLVGLGIVVLIGITAYDQCTEEPLIATGKGIERVRGLKRCVAGAAWKVESDFTGFTRSWLTPWTASHDRVDVVVTSKFWEIVELNSADVFCTGDESGRDSEYIRCYFYTDKVCKAATGSAIGATIAFVILLPILITVVPIGVAAVMTCGGMVASFNPSPTTTVTLPLAIFCAAFVVVIVVALLIFAALILAAATAGGLIAAATSSTTPATSPDSTHDTISNIQIQVGDLVKIDGNIQIREESDEEFHTLRVNVFWWVKSAGLLGVAPKDIPNNPFSYVELNDLFYPQESDETGQRRCVSHDGCDVFTDVMPPRCR